MKLPNVLFVKVANPNTADSYFDAETVADKLVRERRDRRDRGIQTRAQVPRTQSIHGGEVKRAAEKPYAVICGPEPRDPRTRKALKQLVRAAVKFASRLDLPALTPQAERLLGKVRRRPTLEELRETDRANREALRDAAALVARNHREAVRAARQYRKSRRKK